MSWNPIASFPFGGLNAPPSDEVLVCWEGSPEVDLAVYHSPIDRTGHKAGRIIHSDGRVEGGWWASSTIPEERGNAIPEPTHWMPKPLAVGIDGR